MKLLSKSIITALIFSVFQIQETLGENTNVGIKPEPKIENLFDSKKWQIKQGEGYTHREKMLNDILYTDRLRKLNKDQIISELGKPSYYREVKKFLYYIIAQTRFLS